MNDDLLQTPLPGIRCVTGCCLLAVLVTSLGCTWGDSPGWKFVKSWDVRQAVDWKSNKPAPPQLPARLVCTWTDTVLNQAGQKSQRGFGGRIMFFGRKSEAPVRVDGQLVVYAFDETDRKAYETEPTRRYVFPREQFARHESPSKLGPSYSVWLPWDAADGAQKNISLIARFEPHGGPLIVGEQTRHLLPGAVLADTSAPPQRVSQIGEVRLTSHREIPGESLTDQEDAKPLQKSPSSTTIPLSKSWQERLSAP